MVSQNVMMLVIHYWLSVLRNWVFFAELFRLPLIAFLSQSTNANCADCYYCLCCSFCPCTSAKSQLSLIDFCVVLLYVCLAYLPTVDFNLLCLLLKFLLTSIWNEIFDDIWLDSKHLWGLCEFLWESIFSGIASKICFFLNIYFISIFWNFSW